MSLKQRLLDDMKAAMKNKDKDRLSVIRMLRAAVLNEEKNKGRELNDDEIIEVLSREAKKRREAIPDYEKGGRQDQVDKLKDEIEIVMEYLPEQLSEEEIQQIVRNTIKELGAESMKDMGKVMGKLMTQLKGKADGKVVNKIVRQFLQ